MAIARSMTKCLTTPNKVAHALDWKKASGSVLSMRIHTDRIDLAVASHPSFEEPVMALPSIPLAREVTSTKQRLLQKSVHKEMQDVVARFSVCALVVSWPVQKEGWCGASCGRVLNTLDQIPLNRPVCLYDSEHHTQPDDEWGRTELYSETSEKTLHTASVDQYPDTTGKIASEIWNDFCRDHWPEIAHPSSIEAVHHDAGKKNHLVNDLDSSWLEDGAYITTHCDVA